MSSVRDELRRVLQTVRESRRFCRPKKPRQSPEAIAPIYCLRLAFDIARWDGVAIRNAFRDPLALLYGAVFSMISVAIIFILRRCRGCWLAKVQPPGRSSGDGSWAWCLCGSIRELSPSSSLGSAI